MIFYALESPIPGSALSWSAVALLMSNKSEGLLFDCWLLMILGRQNGGNFYA